MNDLIDRQMAIHAFDDCGFCSHGYLVDVLKGLPSEQPQAIRCKDCKYGDWYDDISGHRMCYCTEFGCGGFKAEDFCSRGKADGGESE